MILNFIIFFTFYLNLSNACVYDSYYGVPVTMKRMQEFLAAGSVHTCVNNIVPCDENEGSRIDGTCNNLKHPSYGAAHTPQLRFVEPVYDIDSETRKSISGKPLKSPRELSTTLLKVGKSKSLSHTQLMSYYAEFIVNDVLSVQDTTNYLVITTHCCKESGKTDYMCTPNEIPEDDPVHRYSGYKCMNQTRPFTFQNQGCISHKGIPDRMDYSTCPWDMNNLYKYNIYESVLPKIRTFSCGLLRTVVIEDKEYPCDGNSSCTVQDALDTGCLRDVPNGVIGTNMFSIVEWRHHNFIARNLAKMNPHWDDDKLFYTSRDMNNAINVHIMYDEFWPNLLGPENMRKKGITSINKYGHRDVYDENLLPQMLVEYAMVNRWFHITQESMQDKVYPNGTYSGEVPIVDFTLKVEQLSVDDNLMTMLNGAYRQASGAHDYSIDPEMANRCVGKIHDTLDIVVQDINKGRGYATGRYIDYRDKCTNYARKHKTFNDLEYIIPAENLALLKTAYEHPEDIELMTGVLMEKHIKGGYIPDTAACIILEQLKRTMMYDRHWYERPNRPNAFTREQLRQIKKTSIASVLCNVEDIMHIQPKAFQIIGPGNRLVTCDKIPNIDFSAWKEETCE